MEYVLIVLLFALLVALVWIGLLLRSLAYHANWLVDFFSKASHFTIGFDTEVDKVNLSAQENKGVEVKGVVFDGKLLRQALYGNKDSK